MRNWMNMINEAQGVVVFEDLDIEKVEDHKIVLDDPANDEVEHLEKASPEKKAEIVKKVEKDMHESEDNLGNDDADFDA